MKDIKHIRRDFHLAAWVMPQGWDLGVPWGVVWSKIFFPKFNQIWCVSYLHELHMQRHHFLGPSPPHRGPGEGPKGQISLNLNYKVNFKDFKTKLCISSHIRKIYNISDGIFTRAPGSCPGVGLGGTVGVGGPKFFLFRNSTRFGVLVTYMNCTCSGTIFWVPSSWGLGEGSKI